VTVEAVVRDEKLSTRADRLLVTLVGIFDGDRLDAEPKSSGKILIVLNELQAVPRDGEIADILL
jgi:hypothetical protein